MPESRRDPTTLVPGDLLRLTSLTSCHQFNAKGKPDLRLSFQAPTGGALLVVFLGALVGQPRLETYGAEAESALRVLGLVPAPVRIWPAQRIVTTHQIVDEVHTTVLETMYFASEAGARAWADDPDAVFGSRRVCPSIEVRA